MMRRAKTRNDDDVRERNLHEQPLPYLFLLKKKKISWQARLMALERLPWTLLGEACQNGVLLTSGAQ